MNEEPGRGARFPRRSKQALNFTEPNGRHIHLIYDVEHHDTLPTLGLDHDEECIASVTCTNTTTTVVTFCNAADASIALMDFEGGGLLAGGIHWNCSEKVADRAKILLRKTHGVHRDRRDNRTLVFRTSPAKYQDFFKSAKIRFGTNMFSPARVMEHSEELEPVDTRHQPLGIQAGDQGRFGVFFKKVWTEIKTLVSLANALLRALGLLLRWR